MSSKNLSNLFGLLKRKKNVSGIRTVHANNAINQKLFPSNRIKNTKYTPYNFLFKNLYEQFSRFMNRYFLIIATLQLWRTISPVNPITTWSPLAFIYAVSASRELFDDVNRWMSDKKANERKYKVARGGKLVSVMAKDVYCGDIIYLSEDDEVPADMVLLKASTPNGQAYIQTANLDGESDLKTRLALQHTQSMSDREILDFRGVVECAPPNPQIYKFDSTLRLTPEQRGVPLSLTHNQLLQQATHVRNTDYVYGMIVYTGNETKLGMNKQVPPTKWTQADRFINRTTVIIFCLQFMIFSLSGTAGDLMLINYFRPKAWYLRYPSSADEEWWWFLVVPLRFFLLGSLMIPISLKVTLDVVKTIYSVFINWDLNMRDEESGLHAKAQNTSLAEDLGQVEYIFTDKTGTLTENRMIFKKCSIDGTVFGHSVNANDALYDSNLHILVDKRDPRVLMFLRVLALCNTVVPSIKGGKVVYQASSPDEEALVKAAAHQNLRVVLKARTIDSILITVDGEEESYQILNVLEFSSDRKRMSCIFRNERTGDILLMMKGADDTVLPRVLSNQDTSKTQQHLDIFARLGLRTLTVAYRVIDKDEFAEWYKQWEIANSEIHNRMAKIAQVAEIVERDLLLLGATAIEDKLQQDVPATIEYLREAGIRFWMLTGDKLTTAIQIGMSCQLMVGEPQGKIFKLTGTNPNMLSQQVDEIVNFMESSYHQSKEVSLVVEGRALTYLLKVHAEEFLSVGVKCNAVIVCRATPAQKAEVVKLVRDRGGKVTLAIGDGGNDVSMIQEAHVGIGIAGREGLQAARAADFSFASFRFLKRLIVVHGRYAYNRTAFVSQYSFYKSLCVGLCQMLFGFFSGFSGLSLFNEANITLFNIIYTILPPVIFVLDKDVPEDVLEKHPSIYREGQQHKNLNSRTMFGWIFSAFYQAIVIHFIAGFVGTQNFINPTTGTPWDLRIQAMVCFTAVMVNQGVAQLLYINSWTLWTTIVVFASQASYYITMLAFANIPGSDLFDIAYQCARDPHAWMVLGLQAGFGSLPIIFLRAVVRGYFPPKSMQLVEQEKHERKDRRAAVVSTFGAHSTLRKRRKVDSTNPLARSNSTKTLPV